MMEVGAIQLHWAAQYSIALEVGANAEFARLAAGCFDAEHVAVLSRLRVPGLIVP